MVIVFTQKMEWFCPFWSTGFVQDEPLVVINRVISPLWNWGYFTPTSGVMGPYLSLVTGPILNTLWGGVWTPKHLLRPKAFKASTNTDPHQVWSEDFGCIRRGFTNICPLNCACHGLVWHHHVSYLSKLAVLFYTARSCLTPPCWSPLEGDIPNEYQLYEVYEWNWLLRGPPIPRGPCHFPYDWMCSRKILGTASNGTPIPTFPYYSPIPLPFQNPLKHGNGMGFAYRNGEKPCPWGSLDSPLIIAYEIIPI